MTMTSTAWPTAPAERNRQRTAVSTAGGPSRGVVLAAVDDSSHASAVVRRAAALAAAEDRELVLVTVVPAASAGSVAGGLDRLALLAPATAGRTVEPVEPVEVVEVVAKYHARGGQRRRSRRVGATILRVARAYGAAVIVIGLPDLEHPRDRSVSRRIAHGAPATTRVALVPRTEATGSYEWPAGAEVTSVVSQAAAAVGAKDRRQLAARAQHLQSVELPRLRRALDSNRPLSHGTSERATAEYEAGLTALRTLRHQIDTTPPW